MKKYNVDDKATFKGKDVKIVKKTENFSNGNIIYLLDNGKTVTGKSLGAITETLHTSVKKGKTNIKKLAKEIKKGAPKARKMQIEKPIEIKKESEKDDNNTNNQDVEKIGSDSENK